jgi:dolichyl-phosphate beta-glucosyltransferase
VTSNDAHLSLFDSCSVRLRSPRRERRLLAYTARVPSSLSIIIPVLNEESEIARILLAATARLEARQGEWEILVVDNASTDRTSECVEPFLEDGRIRLLRNDVNLGKGYSIRRGMLEANCQLRLMCDADCVDSLRSLPQMEAAIESADVVLGSRVAKGASVSRQQPLRRRVVGLGFLILTRLVLGRLARDVYCGFKLWRADAAESVFERVQLGGWVFDAEALALARSLGYQLREVGIEWTDRSDSRLSIRNVLVPVVGELLAARRNVRRARLAAAGDAPAPARPMGTDP